jgi:hypothetical protein
MGLLPDNYPDGTLAAAPFAAPYEMRHRIVKCHLKDGFGFTQPNLATEVAKQLNGHFRL